jgi:hypothetical protein
MIRVPPPEMPPPPPLSVFLLPVCIALLHSLAGEGVGGPKSYDSTETLVLHIQYSLYGVSYTVQHVKGTVQRELRWVKIDINRTAWINCIAGKCHFPCPKGHHHESIINVLGGCSTF